MLTVAFDYDLPLADFAPTYESLEDRVASAFLTLQETGYEGEPSEMERKLAQNVFTGHQLASEEDLSAPGVIVHLSALLSEYDRQVVRSSAQLRTFITNKLLVETENANANVRIKALELLGKISDVGLFTDKSEVTLRHRPTAELEQMLRERLTKVIEAEVVPTPSVTHAD